MVKRLILATVLLIFVSLANHAQNTGVKSNLLYWATTTPNLGVETALGKKHTAQVFFGFNPWWRPVKPSSLAFATRIPLLVLSELQWLVLGCSCHGRTV